jgi:hypothetical protein
MDSSIAKIQNTPYTSIKVDTNRIEAIAFDLKQLVLWLLMVTLRDILKDQTKP